MRRKMYFLIIILVLAVGTGCTSSQPGDAAELSQADKDAAVEVVTKHLEGRKNDFGMISLAINSVQTVENAQHLQNILEDEDAAKMGLTEENIALVDAYINVQYDGTKVPYNSGENEYIGFTLIRKDSASPWLINTYGQGLGGVTFMDFENPYPERSAELYVWKNKALTGNDNTYFTVLSEQTNEINKNRAESEIYDLAKASDNLNYINLELNGIPNLTYLAIYQMNTTDFTKKEMESIAKEITLNADNHTISIGLREPESDIYLFRQYPSGYEFIETVSGLQGEVEITNELREKFNRFAKDYRWCYLPDLDGYESFFDTGRSYANSLGYANFANAVFYALSYLRFPEKVSEETVQNTIAALFAAKDGVNRPMPHQAYRKIANYADGYYSPWPEGTPAYDRMFFLLTGLKVEEQESGEVYITVRAKQYYFEHPSYAPGENEKWLAEKTKELGLADLEAVAKLIAENKMDGINGEKEYETTLVYMMKGTVPADYAPRIIFSQSRNLE